MHVWTLPVAPFFVTVVQDRSIITETQLRGSHRDAPYFLNEQDVSQEGEHMLALVHIEPRVTLPPSFTRAHKSRI